MNLPRYYCLGLAFLLMSGYAAAQAVTVSHANGLLTIQCDNADLGTVFEQIEREAGVELLLEDGVKSKRLSATLTEVPVAMAIQRLLEGTGVNYAVMMDPADWGRVDKVFVGAGGGGPSRPQPPPRPQPQPAPSDYDAAQEEFMDDFLDEAEAQGEEDMTGQEEFGSEFPVPGSSPVPSYLPPTPNYPRSRFTPGLPNNPPPTQTPPQGGQQNPSTPPPATFPFMDPFGRPIPVPPGMNPQQQDPNRQQQPPQQQQQE